MLSVPHRPLVAPVPVLGAERHRCFISPSSPSSQCDCCRKGVGGARCTPFSVAVYFIAFIVVIRMYSVRGRSRNGYEGSGIGRGLKPSHAGRLYRGNLSQSSFGSPKLFPLRVRSLRPRPVRTAAAAVEFTHTHVYIPCI